MMLAAVNRTSDFQPRRELAQLAQFWIEGGSQFVAAGLTDQDVKWLRGADLGM
jgi:hypothetical protein